MSLGLIFLVVLALGLLSFSVARGRAKVFAGQGDYRVVHSRPNYHGLFSALMMLSPAILLLVAWAMLKPAFIEPAVLASVPSADRPTEELQTDVFMSEVRSLAAGKIEQAITPGVKPAAEVYNSLNNRGNLIAGGLAIALGLLAFAYGYFKIHPKFRARTYVERFIMGALIVASLIAILTTFGIVFSLLFESFRFFQKVPVTEFLFGLQWSPQTAIRADQVGGSGAFGAVPLFWGTIFIAFMAMVVAVPLGLLSAIYLTQYASSNVRKWVKPVLEILAGVPTVVYGFFAALTLTPLIKDVVEPLGIPTGSEIAIAAGLVMGVMIIPFMSSLSDDAITAVPQAMKDGSLALGATTSETIKRVLIPAALPGIVGGFLLSVSRAIGETMIVVMAAGLAANLTLNPFASVTTVTVQIVALLTGDQEFDSAKTLSAFALGLVLFFVTLLLNIYALRVVKKYREAYE
jgi:phosphate transport system permease protein